MPQSMEGSRAEESDASSKAGTPFVLALDSIDGMRREEWESSIPHDYIIKVKSKKGSPEKTCV